MIMIKQVHTNYSLLIVIDLCKVNQTLLITCKNSLIKNANHAGKEKTLNQNAIIQDLEMLDYITNVKNAEKDVIIQ